MELSILPYLAVFKLVSLVTHDKYFDTSKKSDFQVGILSKMEYAYKFKFLFSVCSW